MDPTAASRKLLQALSAHEIALGEEDILWAFGNAKTTTLVTQWVERYITEETLVSLEELEIYNHLKKTGALSKLQKAHPELGLVRPRSEEDLEIEIEGLRKSTELLRQHTAQLRRQKIVLKAMKDKTKADKERKRKLDERRRKKWLSQKEDLQAAIDDLLSILKEEIVDLKQYMKESAIDAEGVNKMLESDDRVLARLERLAGGVIVGDDGDDGKEVVERVTALSTNAFHRLSTLSATALKTRLDRIFLEVAGSHNAENNDPEAEELQKDLESLYAEIPSVAEMAAEQEFLQPVLDEVHRGRMKASEGLRLGGTYICDVLHHLQKRHRATAQSLKIELSKQKAISTVIATIAEESVSPLTKPPKVTAPSTPPPAPKSPSSSPGKKLPFRTMPVFTPPRHRRGRSTDFSPDEEEYPELRMLALLGISVPPPTTTPLFVSPIKSTPSTPPVPVIKESQIREHIIQQNSKLKAQEKELATGEVELTEAWNISRLLEAALRSGNEFPGTRLIGEQLVKGLEEVESKVGTVAGRMEGIAGGLEELRRGGGDLSGRGEKKAFVERWGR
ncbi:hypothetical protein L873DRAFT_1855405 [Choiromyces venosus 120613-1]|uniref:HAUS augmin-like complex subunit 3 N-terminal domain-containing protein n=1 Tax=Choiromyces venosus 120613-1 TaxID=1336337 RepID=A0A3N4J4A0_9PEZI|nr:hypothetical protein L873DRAFT_1855405 [Choiromyces venosus 120613-1]